MGKGFINIGTTLHKVYIALNKANDNKEELESYSDYPSGVKNNAKRGLELNKKVNNKCATQVGKVRATQLAAGKPISKETLEISTHTSMAEFLTI